MALRDDIRYALSRAIAFAKKYPSITLDLVGGALLVLTMAPLSVAVGILLLVRGGMRLSQSQIPKPPKPPKHVAVPFVPQRRVRKKEETVVLDESSQQESNSE